MRHVSIRLKPLRAWYIVALVVVTIFLNISLNTGMGGLARARGLQSDNGVSAVLHITPDDDPLAGVATVIGLEFNSTIAGFDLNNYKVDATLKQAKIK